MDTQKLQGDTDAVRRIAENIPREQHRAIMERLGVHPDLLEALDMIGRTSEIIAELYATGQPDDDEEATRLTEWKLGRLELMHMITDPFQPAPHLLEAYVSP